MIEHKNKKFNNWIDRITENVLKRVVLFFGILSLVFEFIPSIFNICEMFNYNVVTVFLQPHKDFFVNILLGLTGSAFVSYIILHKSNKLKTEEQQKIITDLMKKIIYKYSEIYNLLNFIIKDKDSKNYSIQKDEEIKVKTQNLLIMIQDYQKCNKEILTNDNIIDGFNKLCEENIIPLIEEIFDFLHILNGYREINKVDYDEDILNDLHISMYKFLYENLTNYINRINKYLSDITSCDSTVFMAQVSLDELSGIMVNYFNTEYKLKHQALYNAKLFQVDQEAVNKLQKRKVEKIKQKIIADVCDNLDLFLYGEKQIDEGKVFYIVNEEKMSVDKYKEYCIEKEFEKRGLTK